MPISYLDRNPQLNNSSDLYLTNFKNKIRFTPSILGKDG